MKKSTVSRLATATVLLSGLLALLTLGNAQARESTSSAMDSAQHTAESKIHQILDPLLEKYCRDECKLMGVSANVDLLAPDELSPGFDDVDPGSVAQIAASSARIKILIDEKVGPVSRSKLMDLFQRFLNTLEFPVKIEVEVTHFPQPIGSAGKVGELRDHITKQFKTTVEDLFRQFCPEHCLLADYTLQTEVMNAEEAQYGSNGEFVTDGGIALRVKDISATLLMDEALTPEEQANIVEMAKLKTNYFKNVTLSARSMRFPHPLRATVEQLDARAATYGAGGRSIASASEANNETNSENTSNNESRSQSQSDSKSVNDLRSDSKSLNESKSDSRSDTQSTSKNSHNENNAKQEHFERFEKIERVENGDAVQAELQKFKVYGLVFACSVLSLLIFIAMASYRPAGSKMSFMPWAKGKNDASDAPSGGEPGFSQTNSSDGASGGANGNRSELVARRYEIDRLIEELMSIYANQPKVAKHVFSRILTEEGVETTAQYVQIFGESVVMDMLRDPSLQADLNELMEFYAKNPVEIEDDEKLDLLKRLHNRTVAGKLVVLGSRSAHQFDFLTDMDGLQILELVRNESLTVKAIVVTQCDSQKRSAIYAQIDEASRMKLLAELSRIDYLPRDYIANVASALKRKRQENPRLNTDALPGSEILLSLLEKSASDVQYTVIRNLERTNPESARMIKSKLVCIDTLKHLREGQVLEVVLSLRHDELLQFLKGAAADIRQAVMAKSPKDLSSELEEELSTFAAVSRETYQAVERKIFNRMKMMSADGLINLAETNERMFSENGHTNAYLQAGPAEGGMGAAEPGATANLRKVAGW